MGRKDNDGKRDSAAKPATIPRMSFSSEDLLQQAIAGLLTRMPDNTSVQILQGTQELGKDIIFYSKGGFGEPVLCACVVKNTKITGDVSKPGGARTILFQAEQCFDTPHEDSFGKGVSVERVYVVTPFDLPPATVASISGRLKERAGRVSFIGGAKLFDLFKQFWPDYFADESEVIERHLKMTRNLYVEESALPSLAFQYGLSDVSTKLMKVYVSQAFHREIVSYEMGELLTASLPDPMRLSRAISKDGIMDMKAIFRSFDSTLVYLNEWGFSAASYDDAALAAALEDFTEQAVREWRRSIEITESHKYKDASVPSTAEVKLINAASFISRARALVEQRLNQLSVISKQLERLKRLVASGHGNVLETLSDKDFQWACLLNDCARAAPEKMFSATPLRLRVNYPKGLHNKVAGPLMIVGAPGYGKTSFCRWHALQDAEQFNKRSADTLPVYIPLHQLSRRPLSSFEDAFLKTMGKSALISKNRSKSANKVRVYLDGLDEVSSPERRREIVDLLRSGLADKPNLQIVMTSRDYIYGRWLNWLPKVNLSEFEDGEVGEFIEKWLGRDTEISAHFHEQLSSQPNLRTLMRTPLLATLVIMVFRQTRRLPESKTRLYEIFVDLLSGGWDMVKGILRGTKFSQREKVIILCSLADKLHTYRRRECSEDLIQEVIKSAIPGLAMKDWEVLRDEIVSDGLISQSGGVVHFGHLSFQEFLAARYYMGTPHHIRILRVLEDYLYGNDWWRDMLKFYIGLSSGPKQISEWLVRSIGDLKRAHYQKVSVPHAHEVLGGIIEAFPEYPVELLAGQARDALDYGQTLSFLQKVKDTIKAR